MSTLEGAGMINVRELLEKRSMYPISSREDTWIKEILE